MKKAVQSLIALCVSVSLFRFFGSNAFYPVSAIMDETSSISDHGIVYTVSGETAVLSGIVDKHVTSVTIPKQVQEYRVTSVKRGAFVDCSELTEICVEEGANFYSENGVLFNKSQTQLIAYPCAKSGDYVIPDNVVKIWDYAFENARELTSVTLPDTLKEIGAGAFSYCSALENVNGSVPGTFGNQFIDCYSLRSLEFADISDDNAAPLVELTLQNCISLETLVIPKSRSLGGIIEISNCPALQSLSLPTMESDSSLTIRDCDALTSCIIPERCRYLTVVSCDNLQNLKVLGVGALTITDCQSLADLHIYRAYKGYVGGVELTNCPSLKTAKFYDEFPIVKIENTDMLTIYGKDYFTNMQQACAMHHVPFSLLESINQMGDIDDDDVVSITDVIVLQKWLLCNGYLLVWENADLDQDGVIDVIDLALLKRLLLTTKN